MVRLDEKSDHRESRMASGSMFGGHSGFDTKKTVPATLVKRNDGGWDLSPTQDLISGEYLITSGVNPQGFDFGIGGPKESAACAVVGRGPSMSSDQQSARELLLRTLNAALIKQGSAGYAEISGDKLILHSDRANEMRFHMQTSNQVLMAMMQKAGISTYLYTNDSEQNFAFDVKAGKIIPPATPEAAEPK